MAALLLKLLLALLTRQTAAGTAGTPSVEAEGKPALLAHVHVLACPFHSSGHCLRALSAARGAARGNVEHQGFAPPPPPCAGAVMLTLRQRLADAVVPPDGWHGWQPGDALPHCSWRRVECSSAGHVTSIVAEWDTMPPPSSKAQHSAAHVVLLPDLARFGSLRQLTLDLYYAPPVAAIPPQWGLPGAFPALEK